MKYKINKNRIWELDLLRGIALILMIYFHIIFDMKEFYNYTVTYSSGINSYIGKISGILFILISGISCSLSKNNIKRGIKILGIALGLTIATYLYDPDTIVKFGILHFLGISIILYHIIQRLNRYILIVLGTFIIIISCFMPYLDLAFDYLFPFGIVSSNFFSSDFYPLIPWFGVFLYGISFGKIIYAKKKSIFNFTLKENIVSQTGKHTLIIYLIHQPVIILILELIKNKI